VNKLTAFSIPPLLLCALSIGAQEPQHGKMSDPPAPMHSTNSSTNQDQVNLKRRLDLAELQREADDLARTAQTIPSDVASVRKGMMPKDVIEKLKQIEKLSKRLRSKLAP
jgi:hypothetical protein